MKLNSLALISTASCIWGRVAAGATRRQRAPDLQSDSSEDLPEQDEESMMPDGPYNYDMGSFPSFSDIRSLFRRNRRGHADEQVEVNSAGHESDDLEMVEKAEPQEEGEEDDDYGDPYNFPTGGFPNFNFFRGRGKDALEKVEPQEREDKDEIDYGDPYNFPIRWPQRLNPSQAGEEEEDLEPGEQAKQATPGFDVPYNEGTEGFPLIDYFRGRRGSAPASEATAEPESQEEEDDFDAPYNHDLGGFPSLSWLWSRKGGGSQDAEIPPPASTQSDASDEGGDVHFYSAKGSSDYTSGPGTTPAMWDWFKHEIANIINHPPPTTLAQARMVKRDIEDVVGRLLQASSEAKDDFRDEKVKRLLQIMLQDNIPRGEFEYLLKELPQLSDGIYELKGIWGDLWKKPYGQRKAVYLARELQQQGPNIASEMIDFSLHEMNNAAFKTIKDLCELPYLGPRLRASCQEYSGRKGIPENRVKH